MSKLIYWIKNYGKKTGATRIQIMFRMLAGGYLLYLAYDLTKVLIKGTEIKSGWEKFGFIVAIVAFALFGGVYLFINLRAYLKKDYYEAGVDDDELDEKVSEEDVANHSSAAGNISQNPDYGEIARAAHWVNPDADTDDEDGQSDVNTNHEAEQSAANTNHEAEQSAANTDHEQSDNK